MSAYTFVKGSRFKIELTQNEVEIHNDVMRKFHKAQVAHEERTGNLWTPDDPISIDASNNAKQTFVRIQTRVAEIETDLRLTDSEQIDLIGNPFLIEA